MFTKFGLPIVALVHHPNLLVCDEPTSALDHKTGHTILDILRTVAVEGDRAVIIVTHDSRIFEFADTMARMDDGRIVSVERGANGEVGMGNGEVSGECGSRNGECGSQRIFGGV